MTFHDFFRNYYANFNTIWHKASFDERNLSLYIEKNQESINSQNIDTFLLNISIGIIYLICLQKYEED